jgi:hypothetical protein
MAAILFAGADEALARKWTLRAGESFRGRLISILQPPDMRMKEVLQTAADSVQIRLIRDDGILVTLPFDQLGREDQVYVRKRIITFWKSHRSYNPRMLQYGRILSATWRSEDRQQYPYDLRFIYTGAPRLSFGLYEGEEYVQGGYCWLECQPGGGATLEVRELRRGRKTSPIMKKSMENLGRQLGLPVQIRSSPPREVVTATWTLTPDGTLQIPPSEVARAKKPVTLGRVEPIAGPRADVVEAELEPLPGLPIHDPR